MKYFQCVQNDNKNIDPKQTIDAIKNAGFDGVFLQWYDKPWEISQLEQLEYCTNSKLPIHFCHLGYKNINSIWEQSQEGDKLVENYINDLKTLAKHSISLVVMHLTSKSIAPPPNEIGLKRIKSIVEFAKSQNIKVAFENTKIFGYLEYVFDNLDYDNMGICYDSGHGHCHFKDKFSWDKFKNKIFAVHIHDNDGTDDQHLIIGDGTIDWRVLWTNLKQAGYSGPIVLENCYSEHYLDIPLQDFYNLTLQRAKEVFD